MIYSRDIRADYDGWEVLGNTGWGYDEVMPYFLKSEHMAMPTARSTTPPKENLRSHILLTAQNW
jgi:choline dehydrogenase-like flavoprotein